MLYEAKDVEDYMEKIPGDWRRETLLQLRSIIREEAPTLSEGIHYKMLGYGVGDDFAFHLNAQKNYVSLYVGNAAQIDPSGELLEGLSVGKGCIRFTKSKSVENTRIREFIGRAWQSWKASGRPNC